jgi:hypothetical protein
MNKTIKIIDLLNKIANGEEIPKRIKYCGSIYEKFEYNNKYYDIEIKDKEKDILSEHLAKKSFYNDKVEIIEDNDKLEKIKWEEKESLAKPLMINDKVEVLARRTEKLKKKIAELIDHINKLEESNGKE